MTTSQSAAAPVARGSDFAQLRKLVDAKGLLKPRRVYYAWKIASTVLLFAAGWVAFFVIGASWLILIPAAYLAVMSTQLAFIGHDAGHKQVFVKGPRNDQLSFGLANFLLGMSHGWWNGKHDRHHANPNHEDKDPDVAAGLFAWTHKQATGRGPIGGWFTRHQGYLFFPVLLLEGLNLHYSSVKATLDGTIKPGRKRSLERSLLALHFALYLAAVSIVLTPGQAVAFVAVHQGLFGLYMGLCFAPNHKGMEIVTKDSPNYDYLSKQVLTSRNIRGGWFVDWALGGLNYQIEHHLFPSMSRSALRKAHPLIVAYCKSIGLPFAETSLWKSYLTVVRYFQEVGASA